MKSVLERSVDVICRLWLLRLLTLPDSNVAITLRRDEHFSIDIHQQKQGPVVSESQKQAACSRLQTDDCKLKTQIHVAQFQARHGGA